MSVTEDTPATRLRSRSERRRQKAEHARALREQDPSLSLQTIAALIALRFGGPCSEKTVADYFWDPDGAKARARKASYAAVCATCGAPTSGGDGPRRPRTRCRSCADGAQQRHSQQSIVATLRAWYREEGAWPTPSDLMRSRAARRGPDALARYERYGLAATVVAEHFGSVAAALAAARAEEDAPDAELAA